MPQGQDERAAQKKMQQGKTFLGKTLNKSAVRNKMREGKIFFERTLTASSLPPHSQVVLPALFVQQHGDKMYKCVTLQNVENEKKWVVEINILFPQNRTQALLYYGWRVFASANGLAIGDKLTFVLVAQSLFHVYIRRRGGNSSLSLEKPKICSQPERRSVRRGPIPEPELCPRQPQLSCDDFPASGCEETELTRTGVTKVIAKGTGVAAEVAAEAPDSPRSPAGMNSLFVEPISRQMIPQEEHECTICQIAKITELGMMKTCFHTALNE